MIERGPAAPDGWAVIMARGLSRRMGFPKGAAPVPGSGLSFLGAVNDLYLGRGMPRVVVTLPELEERYRALLAPDPQLAWVTAPAGGDTAQTLRAAWLSWLRLDQRPARIWAHPVDVPQVAPRVMDQLQGMALARPGQAVRPTWDGRPGHPVVIPLVLLDGLFRDGPDPAAAGPMRDLLTAVPVPVDDPGVVRDFDDPNSLQEE